MSGNFLILSDLCEVEQMSRGRAFLCYLGIEGTTHVVVDDDEIETSYCTSLLSIVISGAELICLDDQDLEVFELMQKRVPSANIKLSERASLPNGHLSRIYALHVDGDLECVLRHEMEVGAVQVTVMTVIDDENMLREISREFDNLHPMVRSYLKGDKVSPCLVAQLLEESFSQRRAA